MAVWQAMTNEGEARRRKSRGLEEAYRRAVT
jgi:hypothetical protein